MAKLKIPEIITFPTATDRKFYFDNNRIEDLLLRYRFTGCTNVKLRDEIMKNTEELIRQIIRAHNLHRIYPGHEETAFMDLFQTAYCQIERVLYKYKARAHCADCYNPIRPMDSCLYDPKELEYEILDPEIIAKRKFKCPQCHKIPKRLIYRGTSKIFNLWSQVARTVILAYIKKENRDYKNSDTYRTHLDNKNIPKDEAFGRFIQEVRGVCKHNINHTSIIDALEKIVITDDRPYEGIIGKLVKISGQSRAQVANFLRTIRLRSDEFSDSPLNAKQIKFKSVATDPDE